MRYIKCVSVPLQPAAPRRRDEVLAFIIERIARSGISPSCPEIGRTLGFSETRAKQLVAELIERGALEHTPGGVRSYRVRDMSDSRIALGEVQRRLGWTTAEPMGELLPPYPNRQLPMLPPFEHLPDVE